jgi:hypothetical protein
MSQDTMNPDVASGRHVLVLQQSPQGPGAREGAP